MNLGEMTRLIKAEGDSKTRLRERERVRKGDRREKK